MNELFYVPSIEEFHVGFECELMYFELSGWQKHVFLPTEKLEGIQELLDKELIRVKYLDREDIESLGFGLIGHQGEDVFVYKNMETKMKIFHDNNPEPLVNISVMNNILDYGQSHIKNKSELKVLLKQLGI